MLFFQYVAVIALGYLLGTSSMTYYLAQWKGIDARKSGSGNLGASNATVLMGWRAGVLVAVHDIGKAILAVLLVRLLFPELPFVGGIAGVACVLGHIFPFYLGFKGGKGLAAYIGMAIALNWRVALVAVAVLVLATIITDYIVVGTVSTIVVVPVGVGLTEGEWLLPLILCVATVVMLFKHRENFQRIRDGKEIGLRSTIRGENRIK